MKIIPRSDYLKRLVSAANLPDIKVVTGIRRSGKSVLLRELASHLARERGDRINLIQVDFSLRQSDALRTADALYHYVSERYQRGKQNFVFIDEVQFCADFERAVTWLHAEMKYSLYITGSNAFLLASDLATLFAGRTYRIEVFPFSFAEYLRYYNRHDLGDAFSSYLVDGGMAGSYLRSDRAAKDDYLRSVYDDLVIRDVIDRHNIKNQRAFSNVSDFLLDNIANLTSCRKIADTMSGELAVSSHTVGNYLNFLTEAFAFYCVRRFDVKGKKYLTSQNKYYLADHAFRYAKLGQSVMDYGRVCENIVAIELLRRGYEVYVGTLYNKEIDFVASRRGQKLYIQVAYDLSDPETLERETASLLKIKDAYPKIILANIGLNQGNKDGIKVIDLAHWLAGEEPDF